MVTFPGEGDESASPNRIPYTDPRINFFALPVALLGAGLAKLLVLPDMLFWYFMTIPMHEMGHTLVAWLGSRFAFPLGALLPMAAVSYVGADRSILVGLFVVLAILSVGNAGIRARRPAPVLIAVALAWLWLQLTFRTSPDDFQFWVAFGGIGGEFVLSTFLIGAFYYRMPDRLRWDFFRFIFLFVGTFVLSRAYYQWTQIADGRQALPWGSFLDGAETGGDMGALRDAHGWSPKRIVSEYVKLAHGCLIWVAAHYLYFAYRTLTARNNRQLSKFY